MYKLLHQFIYCAFFLFSIGFVQAQNGTTYKQLVSVNAEWKNQPDASPALHQQAALRLPEQQLIQLHLRETETLLRGRAPAHLSVAQLTNRLRNLDVLHQYWQAGVFPINTQHSNRQPYFIDNFNTYCAVGFLMKMSGADAMAKDIHTTQNFKYLADIQHPELMNWVVNSGLTLNELALIQPGYGGEWPATIIEMHYNNIGQDVGEYIEIHQSNGGLTGMPFVNSLLFYDHLGILYKTLLVSQMQAINTNYGYYYQFPSNENFADSGKIILRNGSLLLSVLDYNSSGIRLQDNYYTTVRQFNGKEDNTTPIGSSLTFCGIYTTTWNPGVLPVTTSTVNPCTIGALPISLLSFSYQVQNKSIQLNWQTASELNNDYFELQRSTDGINLTTIGKVKGAGTSAAVKAYSFIDKTPNYLNHYRLKQVDKDGKSSHSKMVFVKFAIANPLVVVQNPVRQKLEVQINSNELVAGSVIVYDMLGKMLITVNALSGNQTIDVANLASGKYFIQLQLKDGQVYSRQFVKE